MPGLEEDVGLDISSALEALDQLAQTATDTLGSALTAVVADFSSELGNAIEELSALAASTPDVVIPVTADTSEADSQLALFADNADSTPAQVTLTADTGPAEAAAADVVAAIESTSAEITIGADTGNAQDAVDGVAQSVDDLSQKAEDATGNVSDLGGATEALAGVGGLATGSISDLSNVVGAFSGKAAAGVGAVAAIGASIGEIISKGVDAVAATQRFDAVLGDLTTTITHVQVGDLDRDLFALTREMGTTRSATESAAATIFQFAKNANASGEQAVAFTQDLFVLASRAVAANPALGDVADVAVRMEAGLGRARSAAQQFGISISQTDINTRALADTGKAAAADLTAYEKSVASAEVALERYGSTLDQTITKGSQNAAIEQRRLKADFDEFLASTGKQLVIPAFEALKAGMPIAEGIATSLSGIASTVLPTLATVLHVLGPVIPPVVTGLLAFEGVKLIGPVIDSLVFGLSRLASTLPFVSAELATTAVEADVAGVSFAKTAAGAVGIGVGAALAGPALASMFSQAPTTAAQFNDQISRSVDLVTELSGAAQIDAFNFTILAAELKHVGEGTSSTHVRLEAFNAVLDKNETAAYRLLQTLRAQGFTVTALQASYDKHTRATTENTAAQHAAAQAQDQTNVKLGFQQQLVNSARTSLDSYARGTGSATQALKDYAAAQQNASDALSLYTTQLNNAINPQLNFVSTNIAFGESIGKVAAAYAEEVDKSHTAAQIEADHKAAVIASVQAIVALAGATYAKEVADGRASTAQDVATQKLQEGTNALEGQLIASGQTKDAADAFLRSLGLFPGAAAEAAAALITKLGPAEADAAAKGTAAGKGFAKGFEIGILDNQIAVIAAAQGTALAAAAAVDEALGLRSPSKVTMEKGRYFAQGFALGIDSDQGVVNSASALGRRAVSALPFGVGLSGVARGSGESSVYVDTIRIEIQGVSDPVQAKKAGEAAGDGFMLAVAKQNIRVAVRNG